METAAQFCMVGSSLKRLNMLQLGQLFVLFLSISLGFGWDLRCRARLTAGIGERSSIKPERSLRVYVNSELGL